MSRKVWSPSETDLLRRSYPHFKTSDLAEVFSCSVSQIYTKAALLGLCKSAAYHDSSSSGRIKSGSNVGLNGRFKPGIRPWNKGMKGLDIGGHETRFKPGHRVGRAAELYQPIGTERISKDGYLQRKVNDDMPLQKRWRAVHLLVWEAEHGPLPAGYAVVFRDGDKRNISLENLEMISRAELMRRNTVHNLPPEIKAVVDLKRHITRKINFMERSRDERHQ